MMVVMGYNQQAMLQCIRSVSTVNVSNTTNLNFLVVLKGF